MQVRKHSIGHDTAAAAALAQVVAGTHGPWEDGLIFAASSIMRELKRPDYHDEAVIREVRTDTGVYTLRGSRVATPDGLQPMVSVTAEPVPPHLPPAVPSEKMRRHYRLTRKEARVAQLLMVGKTNMQIATELCISPHTARHHTQSVLAKLGVHSRSQVAAALA